MEYFDSLTHPNFSDNNQIYIEKLKKIGCIGALSVPLDLQSYDIEKYYFDCMASNFFKPIALINPHDNLILKQISQIKEYGYFGVKIHPRFTKWKWTHESEKLKLEAIFRVCAELELPILFCTYYPASIEMMPINNPLYIFISLIEKFPKLKIIFMHGGCLDIKNYINLVHHNDNLLLDISYALVKYKLSSIFNDIIFAMNNLDQKICVGSDSPYIELHDFQRDLNCYLSRIEAPNSELKINNILKNNLMKFIL